MSHKKSWLAWFICPPSVREIAVRQRWKGTWTCPSQVLLVVRCFKEKKLRTFNCFCFQQLLPGSQPPSFTSFCNCSILTNPTVLDGAASFRLLLQTVHISKDHLRCLLENMSIDRDVQHLYRTSIHIFSDSDVY